MEYPTLNYPAIHLRARRGANGRTEIFDKVRGRWLVLTPEEWVRRHVVEYLKSECGVLPQQIIEEHPININGMTQRADIVALGSDTRPLIVVECKKPEVAINHDVLCQAVRYNSILQSPYIVITNGINTYCYSLNGMSYSPIDYFPHYR